MGNTAHQTSPGVINDSNMEPLPQQAVNPSYLETNAQTHRWVFGAIAELIDNSQDAAAKELIIDREMVSGKPCLVFRDNGHGMDFDNLNKMLGLGFVEKKLTADKPVGQYGNGFKSGSMRLAKDALVLTVSQDKGTASVGLLSQTMHKERDLDKMVIPMVHYTLPNFAAGETAENPSLEAILEFSPFHDEEKIKSELRKLLALKPRNKGSGTKIFLFNLKMQKGMLELDFESDPRDIRNPETQEETDERTQHNYEKAFEYKQSLRRYCSILYEKPKMAIRIRGEKVKTCYLRTTLKCSKTYKYKPKGCKDKNGGCEITFGKKTKANEDIMEDYGVMFYHRNRLITPYMKLGCQKKSKGLNVVGVVDVSSVLQPEHNKQRFVDNIAYRSAITAFSSRLDGYCGFAAKIDTTYGQDRKNPQNWVQCDNCQKWRRLPRSSDPNNLPDKWFCKDNPDQTRNRCDATEDEHKDDEYDLADCQDMDCDESSEAGPSPPSASTWQPDSSYSTWQPVRRASTSTLQPDQSASTGTLQTDLSASTFKLKPNRSASKSTWQPVQSASTIKLEPNRRASTSTLQPYQIASTSTLQPDLITSTIKLEPDQSASASTWQPDQNAITSTSQPDRRASTGTWEPDQSASEPWHSDHSWSLNPTMVTPRGFGIGRQDSGSEAKTLGLTPALMNTILREVIKQNPYQDKARWDTVVTTLNSSCEELNGVTKDSIVALIRRELRKLQIAKDIAQRMDLLEELERLSAKGSKLDVGSPEKDPSQVTRKRQLSGEAQTPKKAKQTPAGVPRQTSNDGSTAGIPRSPKCCSVCKRPGHTRATCPELKAIMDSVGTMLATELT